jgi:uncharacterized membrane protein YfhO
VRRVDALVMGVEVPAGQAAFELRYEPPRWKLALAGSSLAALGVLLWMFWGRRKGLEKTR